MDMEIKKILEEIVNLINNLEVKGGANIMIVSNIILRLNRIVEIMGKQSVVDNSKES